MIMRMALLLWRLCAYLPLWNLRYLGAGLGTLVYFLAHERRKVVLTNLRLCFPEQTHAQHRRLAQAHFRAFMQSFLDRSWLWWGSEQRIRDTIEIRGNDFFIAARQSQRPLILLAPHFVGLDAGWTRLTLEQTMMSMYAKQKNPIFNAALYRGRRRFHTPHLLARQAGIRATLSALKQGLPFYYLPDMDFGARDALFVPFFGVPAATITAMPRLAKLSNALIVPCVTRMTSTGYTIEFHAPWDDALYADCASATRAMNALIEQQVLTMPGQYLWLHKRFKTRPPGEARFYA